MTIVDLRDRIALGRLSVALPLPRRSPEVVASPEARELYRRRASSPVSRWLVRVDLVVAGLVAIVCFALMGTTGILGSLALALSWTASLGACGAYGRPMPGSRVRTTWAIGQALLALCAAAALLSIPMPWLPVADIAATVVMIAAGTLLCRLVLKAQFPGLGLAAHPRKVVLRGEAEAVRQFIKDLRSEHHPVFAVHATQILGPEACGPGGDLLGPQQIPSTEDVVLWAERLGADGLVLVGAQPDESADLRRLIWRLEGRDIETFAAPFLADLARPRVSSLGASGVPVLGLTSRNLGAELGVTKLVVDRVLAMVALLLLMPVIVMTALAVKSTSRGPVLFRQVRVGLGGRRFEMLKFRTMTIDAEAQLECLAQANRHSGGTLFKIPCDPRVTRVGRVLRRYSLDELPQLLNVLRGEMSIVGPRPPLPGEVANYPLDAHRRFCVRPGLTGLWQVSGRSDLDPEQSIQLDTHYVEQWSPAMDVRILAKTPRAVLSGDGAY